MSEKPQLDLSSFHEVFACFEQAKIAATVIGGCAVGAYAESEGIVVLSGDLDVLVSADDQRRLRQHALGVAGVRVVSEPAPRSTQTLVVDWRGLEVDALLTSTGPMPSAQVAYESAWTFEVRDAMAHVLEPFALLENKLGVRREKDEPHIEILVAFLRGHVLAQFVDTSSTPRQRMTAAKRLVDLLGAAAFLPEELALMIGAADHLTLRRFLVSTAPEDSDAERIIAAAPAPERDGLSKIRASGRG